MIDDTSREGTCGQNYPTKNIFVISDDNYVQIHQEDTFQILKKVIVPLNVSDTEEDIEILTIKVSPNEELLAILAGKNLIKEIEELHQLFIYKLSPEENDYTLLH